MANREFWRGRTVFVTGHTGFKGGWLATWLLELGARVVGYALEPGTEPSYFARCALGERVSSHIGDVRHEGELRRALQDSDASVVFHLAAQPIVRRSYRQPMDTLTTNVLGTAHLLEAVRKAPSVRGVVVVTSDKCYDNVERAEGYREDEALGGRDPYSASKACAELVTAAWRHSFFGERDAACVATVRAGNVIGGGDWAEDRLVPDAMRALVRGEAVLARHPDAVRPWQHVLEPLDGYLRLAERLVRDGGAFAQAWNFGPRAGDEATVATLLGLLIERWGGGQWRPAPDADAPHEAGQLRLDCSRAAERLGWRPTLSLAETAELTVGWYRAAAERPADRSMYDVSASQIRSYEARAAAHA